MKSPSPELSKVKKTSPVKSNEKEANGNHTTKNTKKKNLNLVKEDKSRKRKRVEEQQKKPKSNGTKSASNASKRKKENKVVANNSNSTKKTATKPSSLKGAKASANSGKGSKSLKPGQGKKTQAENGTAKKLKPDSRNSLNGFVLALQKPEKTAKCRTSSSSKEEAGSSRNNGQIKVDFEGKTRPNSSLSRASSTSLKGYSKALSARQMKVMHSLGLAPPVGSPFIRPVIL